MLQLTLTEMACQTLWMEMMTMTAFPDTEEAANEALEEILEGTTQQPRKGGARDRSDIQEKDGGDAQAQEDFDRMRTGPAKPASNNPNILVAPGPQGKTIILRPSTHDGRKTVEIAFPSGTNAPGNERIKIKYN